MTGVVVSTVLSTVLALLGTWGLRNAPDLVPAGLSEERRAKDVRSLRRGARSCYVASAFFAVLAVITLVGTVRGG